MIQASIFDLGRMRPTAFRVVAFAVAVVVFLASFTAFRALTPIGTADAVEPDPEPAADDPAPAPEDDGGDWIVLTEGADGLDVMVVEDDPDGTGPAPVAMAMAGANVVSVERESWVALENDRYRSSQWALDAIELEPVHPYHDGSGVTVAVIDTAIAVQHEDLDSFVSGYDAVANVPYDPTTWALADADHGTHVAGIIGATAGNGVGVVGGAPGTSIMPVRVLQPNGGFMSDVVEGIIWATDNGADVISLSLGSHVQSASLEYAIDDAIERGVIVVAAVGNGGLAGDPIRYPGAFPQVITVGATQADGSRWPSSSRSANLDLVAPGANVLSLGGYAVDRYVTISGTSMATPYVTATVAAMLDADPGLSQSEVASILAATADDLGPNGWDAEYGHGMVNPAAAVAAALDVIPQPTSLRVSRPAAGLSLIEWDTGDGFWVGGFELLRDDVVIATGGQGSGWHSPGPLSAPATFSGRVISEHGVASTPRPLFPAPDAFNVAGGNNHAVVTWAPVTTEGRTGYAVRRDGVFVGTTTSTTFVDTGVTNGSQHTYEVAAMADPGFAGAWSDPLTTTISAVPAPPSAPTGLSGHYAQGTVVLSWDGPQGALTDILVRRDGVTIAELAPSRRGYVDPAPVAGETHVYEVYGVGAGGAGPADTVEIVVSASATELRYWVVTDQGRVVPFGLATSFPVSVPAGTVSPAIAGAPTSSGRGYWVVHEDGSIAAHGDAQHHGDMGEVRLNAPIVGMTVTPTGGGYWLVARDGGIFSFGDARFHGSTGDLVLNQPVVDMSVTPTGGGYWLVAEDGGVFSFGDAVFYGSTGSIRLNEPMVSIATGAHGYWLVARDGGVFTFGVPFHGSLPSLLSAESHAEGLRIRAVDDGAGYYVLAADGGVFTFGSAIFAGSAAPDLVPGERAVDLMVLQR